MDKTAIKNFAISARRKLIEGVSQKAYGLGISDKEIKEIEEVPDGSRLEINNNYVYLNHKDVENREKLIEQIESKGYEQVMEEVAYTWFNRIIAIRFMEANDYLPSGVRVLSSEESSKTEPDAVTQAHDLVEELELNREKVYNFQDNNDSEGLFKYILIKQCNALGKIMPVMFEKIQDYTELLLPDNLLVEGSVVRDLVSNISEEDFKEQVEIIGWLYQYYISEKKDQVFADLKKNKKITKENIPAATQLFTPDWIVKYMVENSLGRLWLEGHPNEQLQSGWKYYLEEAEQELEVEAEIEKIREESKNLSPEEITVLDPSMGSGHILVYAFDVLYEIYLSAGYSEREIPRLILEKNLYGLDIDDRAGQLAYFALIMKARSYSRRLFRDMERNSIELNVCSIQESNGLTREDIEYFADGDEELKRDVEYLVDVFTDAKEYGSILKVNKVDFEKINHRLVDIKSEISNLFNKNVRERVLDKLPIIIKQALIINMNYHACITNPPYMGSKSMGVKLQNYAKTHYSNSKSDLCTMFIERCLKYTKNNKFTAMITMHSWMFLGSYEKLRKYIINHINICNLVHLGTRAFDEIGGEVVQTVSWTMRNSTKINNGKYIRLVEYNSSNSKKEEFFKLNNMYVLNQQEFNKIPLSSIAYWVSKKIVDVFANNQTLNTLAELKVGLQTGDNDKFLREWYEVNINEVGFNFINSDLAEKSSLKWFPYNKGGSFRRWYGNNEYIINWENNGREIKNLKKSVIRNPDYYFMRGYTWSDLTTGLFGARKVDKGFIFDTTGPTMFVKNNRLNDYMFAYINSKIFQQFLDISCQGLHYSNGVISNLPINCNYENSILVKLKEIVDNNVKICKEDWDLFETSWDFDKHPLIKFRFNNIENSYNNWSDFTEKQFNQLKANEEELNIIFIDIYGLQDELTPEVEEKDITIRKADRDREIKSFISYAVGCMMGRYSLDEEGLAFAGGKFDLNKYKTFKADKDAIIPITDEEYFEDDIVSKFVEFVKIVFGADSLEDNLNYIADTDCFKRKANETSRDVLRRYFLKGFIEDHLKVYQKRPIYWMFDSGKKNGFKALIYMHRYDEDMVGKIRANYLHILQRKYESEINRLDNDMNSEVLSTKEKATTKKLKEKIQKQLVECVSYDQVIAHVAHQRISIDLDDGVKVNYQKFQGVEVPQGDGKKDLKADLLFKVKM